MSLLANGLKFQSKENRILLTTKKIADFLILNGQRIIVQPKEGAWNSEIRLLLEGWAFGALLHQRSILPFHGSSIKVNDTCVVFCGPAGGGKSTLLRALIGRGYKYLGDNIATVSFPDSEAPVVNPEYPQIKLLSDSINAFEESDVSYSQIRPKHDKYACNFKDHFHPKPLPLQKIYVLTAKPGKRFKMFPLLGKEKFSELKESVFCYHFICYDGT